MRVETVCCDLSVRVAVLDDEGHIIREVVTEKPITVYYPFDFAAILKAVETQVEAEAERAG